MIKAFFKGFKAGVTVSGFFIGAEVAIDIFNAIKNMKFEFNMGKPEEKNEEPEESEDEYEPSYAD